MKLIKPSQISGEILTLFEEADKKVIIVSPYCKISKWYKLLAKLKSLIDRKIEIEFYVREGEFETIKEIQQVGIEPICIKNLHSKIYMNEREAIVSSMNLLLSSEMNSLDIAYKTTNKEEYDELLDYYNRYIKTTEKENVDFNKTHLFDTLLKNFEHIRIYENENELVLKTRNNSYNCFIWNVGKKTENKLRISAILSGKEFEDSKKWKSSMEQRTNLEIEFIKGGNGHYDNVWGTSKSYIETQNLNYIIPKEGVNITKSIVSFIKEIQSINPIARICPRNDSAELHSVHTKNWHNMQKIVLF